MPYLTASGLEVELQSQLYCAAGRRATHKPERRGLNVCVRGQELRVVEHVVAFQPHLDVAGLGEPDDLRENQVGVHDSGPVRRVAADVAERAEGRRSEVVRIEIVVGLAVE